jgi:hypothetical protein
MCNWGVLGACPVFGHFESPPQLPPIDPNLIHRAGFKGQRSVAELSVEISDQCPPEVTVSVADWVLPP